MTHLKSMPAYRPIPTPRSLPPDPYRPIVESGAAAINRRVAAAISSKAIAARSQTWATLKKAVRQAVIAKDGHLISSAGKLIGIVQAFITQGIDPGNGRDSGGQTRMIARLT